MLQLLEPLTQKSPKSEPRSRRRPQHKNDWRQFEAVLKENRDEIKERRLIGDDIYLPSGIN